MRETEAVAEARRAMEICNACRYCEGYCAVFPSMEKLRDFTANDLGHLANLCHGCRGCYYACQYAPPHEFGINLPKAFAEVRAESYAEYAMPQAFAVLFQRNGTVVSIATGLALAAVLLLASLLISPDRLLGTHTGPGAFYAVIPFPVMAWTAGATFVFSLLSIAISVGRFWRDIRPTARAPGAHLHAAHDALTLKNLGGGGDGCNDTDEGFGTRRRHLHHALFYGFALCFAATSVASIYDHGFGWIAPYSLLSLPVILGTIGGIGMVIGAGGLIWLKIIGDAGPVAAKLTGADYALLLLLLLVALTGLVLLALRSTPAMGILLAVHLGFVLALFLVLPYSRMVHGAYRLAALLRAAREK